MQKPQNEYHKQIRAWRMATNWTKRRRYAEAGAVADEIVGNCFGTPHDHRVWAARLYAYPWAAESIRDRAYLLASRARHDGLRNPVTAFQKWLTENFPKPQTRRIKL